MIVVVAVIAAVNSGGKSKGKPAAATSASTPTVAASVPSVPDTNPPGTDVASAAAPSVASTVGQFVVWWAQVQPDFNAITGDLTAIQSSSGSGDETGLTTACVSLKNHVITFEAAPPSPDNEVRADLAHAMDDYSTSATECINGNYASGGADLNDGTTWIAKATDRIKTLTS